MTWTLPPELTDIVIDHFHDDPNSLAHCALVRRSWLPTARYHFWHDLRLNCATEELNRLRELLAFSPEVKFHIRDVVVMQKKGEVCQWYDLNLLHFTLSVLSQLPHLTNLTLDGLWFGAQKRGERITSCIVSPSVRKLAISTCSFDTFEDVQRLCRAFPTLTRLQFDGVWWGRWITDSGNEQALEDGHDSPALKLRELDLGSCFSRDKVIEWLLAMTPRDSIETLRLPLIGAYDTRLKALLRSVSGSLKHVEIGSPSSSHTRTKPTGHSELALDAYLDFTSNTNLRTITLGVPTYRDPEFITSWLLTILSQLSSTVLEEIRFAVYPILLGDTADAEAMLTAYGWPEIARTLDKPQFASVRKLTFSSGRSTDYMQIPGAFVHLSSLLQKVIPQYFLSLRKKGVEVSYHCI